MEYDESVFKEKANRRARRIWLIFAILLSANYGSDLANGLSTSTYYIIFWHYAGYRSFQEKYYFVPRVCNRSIQV